MAIEVRLPQLGQTMEEGTIVSCMVSVGDEVKKGDIIFEIETDKATLEMESPADGFVKHILAEADQTLPVGEPLLVLGEKDEEVGTEFIESLKGVPQTRKRAFGGPKAVPAETPSSVQPVSTAEPVKTEAEPTSSTDKIRISPRAKRLAKELGVDPATVTGTGPAGKITEGDIKRAVASEPPFSMTAAPEAKLGRAIPLTKKQKITAQKMLQSKREIPCFYLSVKVDVTDLVALRAELNETSNVKISYNDFIMRAVATGLKKFPIMTGRLVSNAIELAESINIGLAMAVSDGLVAPIVKDVDKKDITQIARDSQALIEKARNNKLAPTDLEGGCITISNLGAFGVESFIPIVVPSQCSILGIGRITDTCIPDDSNIVVRKLMSMTLSVDHKVTNGAYAGQFLDFVRKVLEEASNFT